MDTPDTRKPSAKYSREWNQYAVKACFEKSQLAPGELHTPLGEKDSVDPNFECHVYALPAPILTKPGEINNIVSFDFQGRRIRIYPPFVLNEKAGAAGLFDGATIPEGNNFVESSLAIPNHAVKGAHIQHGTIVETMWCRGLRLDVQTGGKSIELIKLLIDHISQYTRQWWLRGAHNPFYGFQRLGAAIDQEFRIIPNLLEKDQNGAESSWYGTVQFQPNLGAVALLTPSGWLTISDHLAKKRSADDGILAFLDGVADYMAGLDHRSVLNLCISVEIMLNKHRRAILGIENNEKLQKLVNKTKLIESNDKNILQKLIIDRNHVAHGRELHVLGRQSKCMIENYINSVRAVLDAYLKSIPDSVWPEVMTMKLDRTGR